MSKKPRGNIHKIREFELEKIHLVDEFDILQIVGEGWFGKILLVEHRASQTEMVLKAVPKPYVSLRDFYREFHYGLHLGIHRNIVTTYDVAFETAGFYVFTQEYAPLGDLTSNVMETGVGEVYAKRVARQIASALDYMHSKDIVHRDVKLDNVLIYRSDFTRVKLCDFGESYQTGTLVERRNEWLPYSPPEVLEIKTEGTYKADPSHDVWQFGIVLFVCLTGCLPWQKAASDDPRYVRYMAWQGAMLLPIRRTPKLFKLLSSRAQRMFRHFLEPRSERRPKGLADLAKFVDDRWLAKSAEKEMAEYETDELCPSMYSFHSSPDEKHRLLYSLADCGIETNVDRQSKKARIKDWIESSVITEEDEEENEENNSTSPSSSISRGPVAGHISSIRAAAASEDKASKDIKTTLKDAAQKHFDPRTGALQQGPSEMGGSLYAPSPSQSASPSMSNMSMLNGDSLASSLLTLGSRQDLIASQQLQMFSSEMALHRLGERTAETPNQPLSSSHLLLINDDQHDHGDASSTTLFYSNNGRGAAPGSTSGRKPVAYQRSKSDAARKALFSSAPSLEQQQPAYSPARQNAPNAAGFTKTAATNTPQRDVPTNESSGAATAAAALLLRAGKIDSKSVTFAGLANAFQSLAPFSLPANATVAVQQQQQQQQQQWSPLPQTHQQQYANRQPNDSQVKDSAYGSADVSETPSRMPAMLMTHTGKDVYQSNGHINQQHSYTRSQTTSYNSQQLRQVASSVRTQSSQQQRLMGNAASNTMKDTAYDRAAITSSNNTSRRRR